MINCIHFIQHICMKSYGGEYLLVYVQVCIYFLGLLSPEISFHLSMVKCKRKNCFRNLGIHLSAEFSCEQK